MQKISKFIVGLILVSLLFNSSKASDSLSLTTYKYRVSKYKNLQLSGKLNSQTSSTYQSGSPFHTFNTDDKIDVSGFFFNSTNKRVGNTSFQVSTNPIINNSYSKINTQNRKTTITNLKISSSFYTEQLFYKGNKFFTINDNFQYQSHTQKETSNAIYNSYNRLSKSYSLSNNIEFGIGIGRLELVTDAATAMFILQDFKKAGLLNDISTEKIKDLALTITRLNNTRKFDSRKRNIYILEQLDSAMHSVNSSIKSFSILNDNIFYANKVTRFSGKKIGVNFVNRFTQQYPTPFAYYSGNSIYPTVYGTNHSTASGFKLYLENHKPINLHHQKIVAASITTSILGSSNKISKAFTESVDFKKYSVIGSFEYTHNYIPTTRTNISFSAGTFLAYYRIGGYNQFINNSLYCSLGGSYWISSRIQTNFNLSLSNPIKSDLISLKLNSTGLQTYFYGNISYYIY